MAKPYHPTRITAICRGSPHPQPWQALGWLLLSLLLSLSTSAAQAQTGSGNGTRLTSADIDAQVELLATASDLSEEQLNNAQTAFNEAKVLVQAAETHRERAVVYRDQQRSAPTETDRVRQEISAFKDTVDNALLRRLTAERLEQRLTLAAAEVTALRSRLTDQEQRLTSGQTQPNALRLAIAGAREKLQTAQSEVRAREGEPPALTNSRRLLARARAQEAEAELAMLELELSSLQPRMALLAANRDLTRLQLGLRERELAALQTELNERRRSDSDAVLAQARGLATELEGSHALLREVAKRLLAASEELAELSIQQENVTARRYDTEQRSSEITADLERTRQKLEIGGLRITLGQLLMEQRDKLPDLRQIETSSRQRARELAELGLQQLAASDQRRTQPLVGTVVDELSERLDEEELTNAQRTRLRNELRRLLERERELDDRLSAARSGLIQALTELDIAEQQLANLVRQTRSFLDEYLFWIPSHPSPGLHTVPAMLAAIAWLLHPEHWIAITQTLAREATSRPLWPLTALFLLLFLPRARQRANARLEQANEAVGQVQADHFSGTLVALGLQFAMATPVVAICALIGWLLATAFDAPAFAVAFGTGLLWSAPLLLSLRWLHKLCGNDRTAAVHFGRPEVVLRVIRRQSDFLLVTLVPLLVLMILLWETGNERYMGSLGWLAFVLSMAAIARSTVRVIRIAHEHAQLERSGGVRIVAKVLGLAIPVALVALATSGYLYTAMRLSLNLAATMVFAVVAIILHELALRWLTITRRRLRWRQALEKREAARLRREARIESGEIVDEPEPAADTLTIDLDVIDTKTRQLLRSSIYLLTPLGLWFIWRDVLPALTFLENIALWHSSKVVSGQTITSAVTLADVLIAIVLAFAAFGLGRNLPTLLEIVMLQRTSMDPGSRYAVVALTTYFIAVVGITSVFSILGFSWSNIQWMAAALTVGLGFGLQEIFGNFVSGLIILFERPVRVGDTVTVGDLSGSVSKIKIRATTITDWDRKEIIVPNKELITQRVINWTLSDPVTRIKLAIGVAYGSDMEKAHRIIQSVVESNQLVRPEPPPRVLFISFGDSSLNFEVQAFVSELSDRMPTTHALNLAIYKALAANGLEIPFPQRDLHIRSIDPSVLKLTGESKGEEGSES